MTTLAELSPEIRKKYTRMQTWTITTQTQPCEDGLHRWARKTANAVCQALQGTSWQAEARAPYWPHPENEIHAQIMIIVDWRWVIVYSHIVPAYTTRDMFRLSVKGHAISWQMHRGDLPTDPATIAFTVWCHSHGQSFAECDVLSCDQSPTVAIYGGKLCDIHARKYAETGHR